MNKYPITSSSEIIPVFKSNFNGTSEINSVNAREIHTYLEVKTRFADWIKRAIEKYDFIENTDYICILKNEKAGNNAVSKDYIVTLDMAKELAMLENNPKGKEVRKYFIQKEKEVNKPLSIDDLLELNQKAIEDLKSENTQLVYKIKEDQPKVEFANSVTQSKTTILIGAYAKAISNDDFKIGQNQLFKWLRDNGYLINSGNRYNLPMQKYIDNGYFKVKERVIHKADGSITSSLTPMITGLGQVKLLEKIKEDLKGNKND